jgi:hypothetical protein
LSILALHIQGRRPESQPGPAQAQTAAAVKTGSESRAEQSPAAATVDTAKDEAATATKSGETDGLATPATLAINSATGRQKIFTVYIN